MYQVLKEAGMMQVVALTRSEKVLETEVKRVVKMADAGLMEEAGYSRVFAGKMRVKTLEGEETEQTFELWAVPAVATELEKGVLELVG